MYQFGSFQLEPEERRLVRDGELVSLTPKAFDTLVFLVDHAGHLVEKEDLMKALWPDSFVEEANLSQYIWTLRKTLGHTDDGGQFIETVARKGFRFVAAVTRFQQHHEVPQTIGNHSPNETGNVQTSFGKSPFFSKRLLLVLLLAAGLTGLLGYVLVRRRAVSPLAPSLTSLPAVNPGSLKTIAVLPFKPVSADSRNESLEMGMTETLITHLGNLRQLSVRPLGAVRRYVDPQQDPVKVGQELQVDAVLEGSIQKVEQRVRVTVRLTTVHDGTTLWTQQFDEKFTDIFAVQDSIAERVANTLRLTLDGREKERLTRHYTESPEAYQLYLQAQYLWDNRTSENRKKMSDYYEQAIAKDPKFALAYVGLADLQITLIGDNQVTYTEIAPQIAANLTKALQLDPELAQTRNLLAEVKYQFDYDWAGAEKEFKNAIELNPNVASIRLAYGWYLMSLGRFDEATKEMERAQELDPHSLVINRARGRLFYYQHRFDEAIVHFQRMVDAEPNVPINHWVLAEAYEAKGMYAEAVEENARASLSAGVDESTAEGGRELFRVSGWQGYLRANLEQVDRAKGYVSPNRRASLNARLGDKDQAFVWLNKAVEERASGIPNVKVEPLFDSLHSDPRYAQLLKRMNLTP